MPESTTAEQRALLGEQIQRFRYATLAWCLHAVVAANPRLNLERTTERSRRPAEELRYRLAQSIKASNAGLPPLHELTTPREFPMVESWRQVARAAVLGEHDFGGLMDHGRLTPAQSSTVLRDAAEVARALVVLDKRYENIPGWIPIRERGRLDRAAQTAGVFAGYDEPDYSVDHKGWRPPPATIDGGPLPGIGGVLQAEHNMLVHLASFPNALNLRRVMDGQRILSHEAARRAPNVAPDLIEKWLDREQTYKKLIDETRDVGGPVGSGGSAAAEAANAVGRLRHVHVDEITTPEPLRDLDKLFIRTDARVAAIIEQGVADRLYFISVKVPRIIDSSGELVSPVRERYVPIATPINTELLAIARNELRPAPVVAAFSAGAHESRQQLLESLDHRPDRTRGPGR
ncbi:hypothetical protein [Nocardioides aquaticus]|uniref:hypothetical protein n=1 Tax=Nocardioides aquaticus TaxID=160826 RepID=UPI001BD1EEA6|nr:hypothetical protein [Nocardioides aquaticus]